MRQPLEGKVALITGASQGLGLEIARKFVIAGSSAMLCARSERALRECVDSVGRPVEGKRVQTMVTDVSSRPAVDALVQATVESFGRIDVLVNNAGIYGPMGATESVDWGEWLKAIEVNLLGSVLMCRAVVPVMKAQHGGKIIQLSGGGATGPLPRFSAYAASKAAVVRFAETLAEEVRGDGIDVNCLAPGALNTQLLDQVLAAGPRSVGEAFYQRSVEQKESGGAGFEQAAELATFLAADVSNGITAKLISAVWDQWQCWPEHADELRRCDVYTLRRIVGRDRGLQWGDK